MKRHQYFTFVFLFVAAGLFAQSQRMVLLEQFTQASCGPCAGANPTIKAILDANPEKITSVWYHVSWPGYDPMNGHNPGDVSQRVGYYNINAVPHSVLDGNYYSGSPGGWNTTTVNNRYAVPSPFEVYLYEEVPASNDRMDLTLLIKATESISATNLLAYMVIVEDMTYSSPPGSNGEKFFPNVMKKLLPKKSGATLPDSFEPGDYVILQSGWEYANVLNPAEVKSVVFIQDNDTKEMHQAGNGSGTIFSAPYSNDAEITEIGNIATSTCLGSLNPRIMIRNNGGNVLTSLDIHYSVNGGAEMTYQWSGNLSFLESEEVELDEIAFSMQADNDLKVYCASPNGASDDYPKNDTLVQPFDKAHQLINTLRIVIITDDLPQETTWEVTNTAGEVVFSGGPYSDPGTIIQEEFDVTEPDCYKFTVYDSGGNGLCCENGQGAWGVYDNNVEIDKGGMFTYRDSTYFRFGTGTGMENKLNREVNAMVYPNPFSDETNIDLFLTGKQPVTVKLVNTLGETVKTSDFGILSEGEHVLRIDCSGTGKGVYILQVNTGEEKLIRKVFIQ